MKKIVIYSTPTCGFCKMAKEFFKQNNIEYTDIDVSVDQEKSKEMVEKSGQMGVPVIIITAEDGSEEIVIGFDKDKLGKLLIA